MKKSLNNLMLHPDIKEAVVIPKNETWRLSKGLLSLTRKFEEERRLLCSEITDAAKKAQQKCSHEETVVLYKKNVSNKLSQNTEALNILARFNGKTICLQCGKVLNKKNCQATYKQKEE